MDAPAVESAPSRRWLPTPEQVAWAVLPPAVAWVFSRIVVTIASLSFVNPASFQASPWDHWDSKWYLNIARVGRTFYRCPALQRKYFPSCTWYGSAGWLPGYPYLVRAAHLITGVGFKAAAVLVSLLFAYIAMFAMWNGLLTSLPRSRSIPLLLLFAVFPGAVYLGAIFPMSVALTAVVLSIVALKHHQPGLGALALAGAVICYPSALYILPAYLIGIWMTTPETRARAIKSAWILVPPLPLVGLFIHDRLRFHHWNAYLLYQKQAFGTSLLPPKLPWVQLWDVLVTETQKMQLDVKAFAPNEASVANHLIALQAGLATLLVLAPLAILWWKRHDALDAATEVYPMLLGALVWIGILLSGVGGGWTRAIVLAAPSVVFLRRFPPWVTWVALVVVTGVTVGMSHFFFTNAIL